MKTKFYGLILLTLIVSSCRSKPPEKQVTKSHPDSPKVTRTEPKAVSLEARQIANEQRSNLVTEIKFDQNSGEVSSDARSKIKKQYQEAADKGDIKEVQVITWGDKEYPSADKGKLAGKQRELVEKRNEALEKYLSELDQDFEVRLVSMAERPSRLKQFFTTENAEIKESLEDLSIPKTDDPGPDSKASRSIVIFILDK